MSGGTDDDDGPKWPRPVQMVKDDSKRMRLIMSVEGMELTKPFMNIGRPKPLATNTITHEATSSEITLQFKVPTTDGESKVYEYKKKLPLDILPEKTLQSIQYKRGPKGALVELTLWKAKEASWTEHTKYLTTRNKEE